MAYTQKLRHSVDNKGVGRLIPLLGIGAAGGAAAAVAAVYLLGAGLLTAFLIYSFVGAFFTILAAWLHVRCIERGEGKKEMIAAQ